MSAIVDARDAVGYYGRPIVKAHPWKGYIAAYFFTGGVAGASSVIAAAADVAGRAVLARDARRTSMAALAVSPVLLIADLGRPERFGNMLRVVKPTSPMNMGSWLLSAYSAPSVAGFVLGELHRAPRLRRPLALAAGLTGAAVTTYTGVLVADTATPVWREARRDLPRLFAASAASSAGGLLVALSGAGGRHEPAARRIAVAGAAAEVVAAEVMKHRLGDLDAYARDPSARRFDRAASVLGLGGAAALALGRRSRAATIGGGLAVAAGSLCERFAVLRAGTASAHDPAAVLTAGAAGRARAIGP